MYTHVGTLEVISLAVRISSGRSDPITYKQINNTDTVNSANLNLRPPSEAGEVEYSKKCTPESMC